MNGIIYCFINPLNKKRYVGQTINFKNRMRDHKNESLNPLNSSYHCKFYQALRKYGFDHFIIEVLEVCGEDDLDLREEYWIEFYNSFVEGYNSTRGGKSVSYNILFSEEVKNKRLATLKKTKALQSENHPRAKLKNEDVVVIRQRYKDGETVDQIWQDHKNIYASKDVFRNIVHGVTYKDVGNVPKVKHNLTGKRNFSKEQILEIRSKFDSGLFTISELAKEYERTYNPIYAIVHRKSYKNIE